MKTNLFKIAILLTLFVALLYTTSVSKRLIEKDFAVSVNEIAVTQFEENDSYAELQLLTEAKNVKLIIVELLSFFIVLGLGFLIIRETIYIRRKMNEKNRVDSANSSSSN